MNMILLLLFIGGVTVVAGQCSDPNCGWCDQPFRAVGDWAIDAGASSNWNPAEPLGLMTPTHAQDCEYAVEIHGLKIDKLYNWRVTVANSWDVVWGCAGRNGPNCTFFTPTGSVRLSIVGSFAYPLTAHVAGTPPPTSTWPTPPSTNSTKKVFAHYMVGFAYPSDQDFFNGQIERARAAGIDGFALNVGIDEWQPDRVAKAFAAAQNNGDFALFISFDVSSLGFNKDVLSRFHSVASHPNYFKVDGRPLYSTFAGENQDSFWQDWKTSSGLNPYFCPSWPNYPTENLLQSHPVADCIFTWNAWPQGNSGPGAKFDTTGDRNLLASARATNKTYMAPLAPWFYSYVWGQGWYKNWIYGSEQLLPRRWEQIIALQPDFVEIITWNDYSESSYICPISSDAPIDMNGISNILSNPSAMNHDAWLDLSEHYIQWYKNNARPMVTNDQFYWWYRTHPKGSVTGDPPNFRNDAEDCVVVHSIVKSVTPSGGQYKVVVNLNGSVNNYTITQLEQTECIAYPSSLGNVTISLIGPDSQVWWSKDDNAPQRQSGDNFNAFANSHTFPSP